MASFTPGDAAWGVDSSVEHWVLAGAEGHSSPLCALRTVWPSAAPGALEFLPASSGVVVSIAALSTLSLRDLNALRSAWESASVERAAEHAALQNVDDVRTLALSRLHPRSADYVSAAAEDFATHRANVSAWNRWSLRPRVLVDVSEEALDLSTTILGQHVAFPIGISPTSLHKLFHRDGEAATMRAAAAAGTVMTLSTSSTLTLEDVASAAPATAPRFFQLYVYRDRALSASLVQRAERAGYTAIVVTVDHPVLGNRESLARIGFRVPAHIALANTVAAESAESAKSAAGSASAPAAESAESDGAPLDPRNVSFAKYAGALYDQALTWECIAWLRSTTSLPIVVKGVMTAEDAECAVAAGVAAIWVSNHGGRQLDACCATAIALEEVARAVRRRCEVWIDGGVRRGRDVLRALALGASAVFVGRPALWGLAIDGQAGVERVLEMLRNELQVAMQLCGCPTLESIDRSLLYDNHAAPPSPMAKL